MFSSWVIVEPQPYYTSKLGTSTMHRLLLYFLLTTQIVIVDA